MNLLKEQIVQKLKANKKMKFNHIGLYFGSFNPIHNGHLWVIEKALNTTIDKLYLVVSPQSPFKPLSELAPFEDRLEMVRLAIKSKGLEEKVEAVNWEEHMYPSYTAKTLQAAVPMLQENKITIYMGLDNFLTIDKWKEPQYILENFGIYVIPRGEENSIDLITNKVKELRENVTTNLKGITYSNPFDVFNMAATNIREKICLNESIDNMTVKEVIDYIQKKNLYKKELIKMF